MISIEEAFRKQAHWSTVLGSPFSAELNTVLAELAVDSGPAASLTAGWQGDPVAGALALRVTGGLHALVLRGDAPDLAAHFPPHDMPPREILRQAVARVFRDYSAFMREFLASPPQTNEVGRSAVLLGGFLHIAQLTGLPLRTLEIGASAGLNLIWDKFRIRVGGAENPVWWGNENSQVVLAPEWQGGLPPAPRTLTVAERAGCDIAPVDLNDAAQRLRLRAFVWPDQPERLARVEGAIALAHTENVRLEQADAADWAKRQLAGAAAGRATVLYHSIMWHYLPAGTQAALRQIIQQAGARATKTAPLAWLRLEFPRMDASPELLVTTWPAGTETRLAEAQPHGSFVRWLI